MRRAVEPSESAIEIAAVSLIEGLDESRLRLVNGVEVCAESRCVRALRQLRHNRYIIEIGRWARVRAPHHKEADEDKGERRDLQDVPEDGHLRALVWPLVADEEREQRARRKPAQMRRVVYEPAPQKPYEEIERDHRQEPGAESTLEAFRQFVPKFYAEDEEHPDEPKERARCARRRIIGGLEKKTIHGVNVHLRPHGQVACGDSGDAGHDPEDDKLRRAVKLLDVWADHPERVHIDEQMRQADVNKDRRHEPPPLMVISDQIVKLRAVSLQERAGEFPHA